MESVTDQEIRTAIRRVIGGELSLADFESRFVGETWDEDSPLIREVTGILAETGGNDADDVAIERLHRLVSPNITLVRNEAPGLTIRILNQTPTRGAAVAAAFRADFSATQYVNDTETSESSIAVGAGTHK